LAPVTIAGAAAGRSDVAQLDSSGGARLSEQGAAQRRLTLPDQLPDQDFLLGPKAFDRMRRLQPAPALPGNNAGATDFAMPGASASAVPGGLLSPAQATAGAPSQPSVVRGILGALGPLQPPPQAAQLWARLGVPSRLGSYAWAIAPKNSASGEAMLYGGPQMGFSAPEIVHEVQLSSADGFDAIGMAFAGVPYILIGHNKHLAWTSTTAVGDNVDIYYETLCEADEGQPGTRFNGACVPLQHRRERIEIAGQNARDIDVWRSPHGPALVVPELGIALAQKRAHWQREAQSLRGFKQFNLAADLSQFAAGTQSVVTQHNFLYADRRGNIAYWQAGELPRRPAGFDFRLPLPGDGSAEWLPELQPTPSSINPPQGFLANWNSQPCAQFDSADNRSFGKQFRQNDLLARLHGQKLTWEDMHDIAKDIARVDLEGRKNRFLQGYLQEALDARATAALAAETRKQLLTPAVPEADAELPGAGATRTGDKAPDAAASNAGTAGRGACSNAEFSAALVAATELVRTWSGESITHAVHSTTELAAHALFDRWIIEVRRALFDQALGKDISSASLSLLVRLLDRHLGPPNPHGLPVRFDYLRGQKAVELQALLCTAFDAAVAQMVEIWGSEVQAWTPARPEIALQHPLFGVVGSLPLSNRATYAQVLSLSRDGIWGENIFSTGQSGKITADAEGKPVFDPHFADLLPLFKNFEYKRMRLLPWPGHELGH
jgi:acyl-homoserine lactone acylase PvdQ